MPPFNQPWADTATDWGVAGFAKGTSELLSGDLAGAGDAYAGSMDEAFGWLGNTAAGNQPDGSGGVEPDPDRDENGPDYTPDGEDSPPDLPLPDLGGGDGGDGGGGGGGGGGGVFGIVRFAIIGIIVAAVAWAIDSVGGVVGDD